VRIAAERGRQNPGRPSSSASGGEHGGDPASIRFCAEVGLDYVSCSPYRVPSARLAAAAGGAGGSGRRGRSRPGLSARSRRASGDGADLSRIFPCIRAIF